MQFLSRLFLCIAVTSSLGVSTTFSQEPVSKQGAEAVKSQSKTDASKVRKLEDSVSLALASHPRLKVMTGALYAQMAEIEEQESALLPQLILSLGLGREYSDNSSTRAFAGSGSENMERREASLGLRQLLFDGYRSHWMRENGIELGQARHLELISQSEMTAFEAIRVHLAVMRENLALEDHIANLQTHERIAKNVGMRARLGKDDRAKVSQISARLSLSLANVETAKSKLRAAEAEYFRVIGEAPGKALAYSPGLVSMPESLESLMEEVMASNPQLLSESRLLKASKAEVKAAKSSDMPSLYLESGASWNDNLDGVRGRNNDAFVMLRMSYDLFSGGRDTAQKNKAAQELSQATFQLEDIKREYRLITEQAWHDYQSLSRRASLLQDYVESAESTKKAYIKQFDIGQRSLIDLLDAENELLNAKRLRSEARYGLYLVKFNLLRLQGSLLNYLSEGVPISSKVAHFLEEKR